MTYTRSAIGLLTRQYRSVPSAEQRDAGDPEAHDETIRQESLLVPQGRFI